MINVNELKKGIVLELDKTLYQVTDYELFKAGKGNSEARIRIKLRDLKTGLNSQRVFQTSDRLPRAIVEKRQAQFAYQDGDIYYFMDSESFEQVAFNKDTISDSIPFLKDGMGVVLLLHGEQPVSLELPITVDLKVSDTSPGFKGDTASNVTKPATVETGTTLQVPLFVNNGDVVRVDTRTGQYLERVG